jgi:deoxyadenosine/deoxycytidine kinase
MLMRGKKMYYIAVGGNTGAGKSTLVKALADRMSAISEERFEAVDERRFHHPLLTNMFFFPKKFAFAIQLNFLLQRALFIKDALNRQASFVMERSHYEDPFFIRHHLARGNISDSDYNAYQLTKSALHRDLPSPTLYIRLRVDVETSIKRVRQDEADGKRPEEFPSEQEFRRYVEEWQAMYNELFYEIDHGSLQISFSQTLLIDRLCGEELTQTVDRAVTVLQRLAS